MLAFWFWVGSLVIGVCAWRVWRRHRVQQRRVLLIDAGFPAGRLEGRLSEVGYAWAAECSCWFVWLPRAEGERKRLLPPLAARLGFELLSAGELRRMAEEDAACRFYRLAASGRLCELTSAVAGKMAENAEERAG